MVNNLNNKFSWGIIILSLVYVPVKICGVEWGCYSKGHRFLLDLDRYEIALSSLFVQVIVAIVIAIAIEKFTKK